MSTDEKKLQARQAIIALIAIGAMTPNGEPRYFSDLEELYRNLKPCPFCGRRDKLKVYVSTHTVNDSVYKQYTIFCDASGDKTGCGASCGYRRTKAEAITAWNRRADDA